MNNAFNQADAMVQVCSGIFGIARLLFFAYRIFFRNKKK